MSVPSRRLLAVLLDSLLFLPIWLLAFQYERGVQVLVTAICLVYFYVSDTTSGQTVGKSVFKLRTVTLDGQIVSGRAASGRTVLRLVDHTLIGLIVMVFNGDRRRIGDFAARTKVVDAREVVVSRPFDVSMIGYPLAWLVPALLVFTLTAIGRFPGSYRVTADAICAEADSIVPSLTDPQQLLELTRAETRDLERLDAPPHWADRHEILLAEYHAMGDKLDAALRRVARSNAPAARWQREAARLARRAERSNARLAVLGYEGCAGSGSQA